MTGYQLALTDEAYLNSDGAVALSPVRYGKQVFMDKESAESAAEKWRDQEGLTGWERNRVRLEAVEVVREESTVPYIATFDGEMPMPRML